MSARHPNGLVETRSFGAVTRVRSCRVDAPSLVRSSASRGGLFSWLPGQVKGGDRTNTSLVFRISLRLPQPGTIDSWRYMQCSFATAATSRFTRRLRPQQIGRRRAYLCPSVVDARSCRIDGPSVRRCRGAIRGRLDVMRSDVLGGLVGGSWRPDTVGRAFSDDGPGAPLSVFEHDIRVDRFPF